MNNSLSFFCFYLLLKIAFYCGSLYAGDVTIIDSRHYSIVFGEIRNFRIFLPPGYFDNPQKKYPVIYYYHGYSQRYFGNALINVEGVDKGNDNHGDNIENFVAAHEVIVVKPDGYNRSAEEEYYLRPYNVAPVETFRQFPIYFPELVNYIDANYNTLSDKNHRAITGLSMGGFMSLWIGGKYPHLISAIGNFCGSAEFVVGPKDFPVEYRHLDMYKNYVGINVRLNYGNEDFIRYYHRDMNKVWTQVLDNYEFKIYKAAHSACGLGEMFEFIMKTFENPPEKPTKWDHIDVYPEFSVWDYHVSSDRDVPGFTVLENVDKRGFRCSVREHLPNGEIMPFVSLSVTTSPEYEKNQLYVINDVDCKTLKATQNTLRSDNSGRLKIDIDGGVHEIGINNNTDKPNICINSFEIKNMSWATHRKDVILSVKLLNKGQISAKNVEAELSAIRSNVNIIKRVSDFDTIAVNEIQECKIPFTFYVPADSIEIEKFMLTIKDKNNNVWRDFFEITLFKDLPEIRDFEIADGKTFTVAKEGDDVETIVLGFGNGDGVANPGESIVVLVKDLNKLWRTSLVTSDKYVNPFGINIRKSDNWGLYDAVGGSAKYSVPVISSNCPDNHEIDFAAEYWLPADPNHIITQGKISIKVTGKDITPPESQWVRITGDNVIQIKMYDGSKINSVKAKLILKDNPGKFFKIKLNDDGKEDDKAIADNLFSKKIPDQNFGLYRMEIEATDSCGNKMTKKCSDIFVLH